MYYIKVMVFDIVGSYIFLIFVIIYNNVKKISSNSSKLSACFNLLIAVGYIRVTQKDYW
jgi:hypothetical protein